MRNLKIGLILTFAVTPIFILFLVSSIEQSGGADINPIISMFFIIIEAIGLLNIIYGIKQIIRTRKKNELGDIIYGRITLMSEPDLFPNGEMAVEAEIYIYIQGKNEVKPINEIIGYFPEKYNVGDYVQLKFQKHGFDIVQVVSENMVPGEILKLLKEDQMIRNRNF